MQQLYKEIRKYAKVRLNEPMKKHTTFKIGGPASFFITIADIDNLPPILKLLDDEGISRIMLGGGSNVLFPDDGYEGAVIKVTDMSFEIQDNTVKASAGAIIKDVSRATVDAGLTGFEWAIGVPGTIAGALRGNAAYNGVAMEDGIKKVEVYRDGEVLELSNEECAFGYKETIFKYNSDIILHMWLSLKKGDKKQIEKEAIDNIQYRETTQPKGYGSAGCTFKNVVVDDTEKRRLMDVIDDERIRDIMGKYNKVPVGRLIDLLGLKGEKRGNAQISEVHANFIVNLGDAKASDVKELIELIKEKVYATYSIQLEEEIHVI